jgi:O-methyltransferase
MGGIRQFTAELLGRRRYENESLELATNFVTGRNVAGDYLEFGVHEGRSFIYAVQRLTRKRRAMAAFHATRSLPVPPDLTDRIRFFAFDSFAGLPEPTGADATDKLPSHWRVGQFCASEEAFAANVARAGVNVSDVVIVPGWFNVTLTSETKQRHALKQGAIFHIDCDLYESSLEALNFITDLYVDGSIVIFDDWFGFRGNPNYGEQRAFRDWSIRHRVKHSEFARVGGQSMSFILHRD